MGLFKKIFENKSEEKENDKREFDENGNKFVRDICDIPDAESYTTEQGDKDIGALFKLSKAIWKGEVKLTDEQGNEHIYIKHPEAENLGYLENRWLVIHSNLEIADKDDMNPFYGKTWSNINLWRSYADETGDFSAWNNDENWDCNVINWDRFIRAALIQVKEHNERP